MGLRLDEPVASAREGVVEGIRPGFLAAIFFLISAFGPLGRVVRILVLASSGGHRKRDRPRSTGDKVYVVAVDGKGHIVRDKVLVNAAVHGNLKKSLVLAGGLRVIRVAGKILVYLRVYANSAAQS